MSKHDVERGIEIAITRLEDLTKELEAHADRFIWEEGKGDFFADGCAYGAKNCVETLKRLLRGRQK